MLLATTLLGCASAPVYRRDALPPPVKPGGRYVETGLASYYADEFHGRSTASGEFFDMHAFTAAHRSLPLGTVVKVKNRENGRSTLVTINDRGPFVSGRIIDLSYAAAKELRMTGTGTARVRIEVIEWGEE